MASNNPADYINPIIQAMAHAASGFRENRRIEEEKRQHDILAKERDQQIKQHQQEIDQTHEYQSKTLQALHDAAQAKMGMDKIQATQMYAALSGQGVDLAKQYASPDQGTNPSGVGNIPNVTIPGTQPNQADLPLLGRTNISAFPTPEKAAQLASENAAKIAGAQTAATEAAKAPFEREARSDAYTKGLALGQLQHDRAVEVAKMSADRAEKVAGMNNATQLQVAKISAAAHLAGLQQGNLVDPQYLHNTINDVYITGNTPLTQVPTKVRQGIVGNVPAGWSPIDPKDKVILGEAPKIESVLDVAKHLAEYSLNSNIGGTVLGTVGLGDASRLKNELTGLAGNIAETFGKEVGRKSEGDIQRAVKLLYSPTLTREQNLKNVQEAETIFKSVLSPVVSKYGQASEILAARGVDPSRYVNSKQPTTNQPEKRINVIRGDGKTGHIPESQLQDALKQGYKVAP